MAAERGLCPTCGGNYAVAQDGTPYKHSIDGIECAGSDSQVQVLAAEAVWLVYGDEGRFVVHGPVQKGAEHPAEFPLDRMQEGGPTLPLLGEAASAAAVDVNPLLPGDLAIPEPSE